MLSFDDDARWIDELREYVAIPSISRDADRATMDAATRWLVQRLDFAAPRVLETGGHPAVVGEWAGAPGAPTVLVYGHYDVQPTGDPAQWHTPPFELAVEDGVLRGRGVTDDKGPVYIALEVMRQFLAQEGRLPINVRFLFEGEEEIGSPHLPDFVRAHADELRADLVISADGAMWRPSEPSVSVASKGLLALDIEVTGANRDLHSGRYGGTVANPVHALAQIVASLHHPDGRIAVDGFTDGMLEPDADELARIDAVPFDEHDYAADLGVDAAARRAGPVDPAAAVDAAHPRGQRHHRRRLVHRDPGPGECPRHVPARPGAGPGAGRAGHRGTRARPAGRRRAGERQGRAGRGARVHDRPGPPGDPGGMRGARARLPRPGGAARADRRHAAGDRPVRGDARRQDAVLLLLDGRRAAARAERVPADPAAARGDAGLGAAVPAAGGGRAPTGRLSDELPLLRLPRRRRDPAIRPRRRVRPGARRTSSAWTSSSRRAPRGCSPTAS